jgi:hypothetical protein
MKKRRGLDKVLTVLGYFVAAFLLVMIVVGIIVAIIKMSKKNPVAFELPQTPDPAALPLPDGAPESLSLAEPASENLTRKEEAHGEPNNP